MLGLFEFQTLQQAEARHAELCKLGWNPYSIYRTVRGTWAFWIG